MSISIVLTNAGLAAIVNARNTGTNLVEIVEVGFTQTAFASNAATAAIPGEFARLTTMSGDVVADDTVHLVVRDESAGAYGLRGLGLYLADGTLLGTYSQANPIVQKTAESIVLLAIDIKLAAGDAATIAFGDTDFLNPPATTERQGVIELATAAEALAGIDPDRAITPATLKPLLDALLKLAGEQTVTGNVGFGGAPPVRSVTANSELVIRNSAAQANYRNWNFVAAGAAKGGLSLRLLNDAATAVTLSVLSIDAATGATDFAAQPKVNGAGIWHGGNMVLDVAASGQTVPKRMDDGSLRATWFMPEVGLGLRNAAGYYFYTDGDGGSRWHARGSHATDAGIMLQRKDGSQLGGLYGGGGLFGFVNAAGAWRLQSRITGDLSTYSDAGIESQVLLHNRLPVNTAITSLDGSQRLRFTPAGRSTYSTPEAHEFTGGPTYFQSSAGTNGFEAGTGDGATYATYNVALKVWNGLALRSHDGAVNLVFNSRTGDITTKGNVFANYGSFGGAPAIRQLTVNSELVVRNVTADANYRNWNWIATGAGKGALHLRMLNDAGSDASFTVMSVFGEQGGVVQFWSTPTVLGNGIWHAGNFDPASKAPVLHSHDWAQVTGKPAAFPPEPHAHDLAGVLSSVAAMGASGYFRIGQLLLQWGGYDNPIGSEGPYGITFPLVFPNACFRVFGQVHNVSANNTEVTVTQTVSVTQSGATFLLNSTRATFPDAAGGFGWFAIGA